MDRVRERSQERSQERERERRREGERERESFIEFSSGSFSSFTPHHPHVGEGAAVSARRGERDQKRDGVREREGGGRERDRQRVSATYQ